MEAFLAAQEIKYSILPGARGRRIHIGGGRLRNIQQAIRQIRQAIATDPNNTLLQCFEHESRFYQTDKDPDLSHLRLLVNLAALPADTRLQNLSVIDNTLNRFGQTRTTDADNRSCILTCIVETHPHFPEIALLARVICIGDRTVPRQYLDVVKKFKNIAPALLPTITRHFTTLRPYLSHMGGVIEPLVAYYKRKDIQGAEGLLNFYIQLHSTGLFNSFSVGYIYDIQPQNRAHFISFLNEAIPLIDRPTESLFKFSRLNSPQEWRSCLEAIRHYTTVFNQLPEDRRMMLEFHLSTGEFFDAIRNTPIESRLEHAHALTQRFRNGFPFRGPAAEFQRIDLENVMNSTAIDRTKKSILKLDRLFSKRPAFMMQITSIADYLQNFPLQASEQEAAIFARIRAGDTEQNNALRTLTGARRPRDYSESVSKNTRYNLGPKSMGMGEITALVWHAINQYRPSGQSEQETQLDIHVMRYQVFKALSQCIEDDGHRVCSVGFAQRITTTLQGYYKDHVAIDDDYLLTQEAGPSTVLPQQFFTQLAQDFDKNFADGQNPSLATVLGFVADTVRQAREVYGEAAPQVNAVAEMAREYVRVTYDFNLAVT